jgi:glucose/arabinose dehydrogenase
VIPYEPRGTARTRPSAVFGRTSLLLVLSALAPACSDEPDTTPGGVEAGAPGGFDASVAPDLAVDTGPPPAVDAPPLIEDAPTVSDDTGPTAKFCELGTDVPNTSVPGGFCLRKFASINVPRTMVFAPNGDLFVAAPSAGTAGGASGGPGGVILMTDDNKDGVAEMANFAGGLADVHGIAVGDGYLYFTTQMAVWRTPYTAGQRLEDVTKRENLGLPSNFGQGYRWTHGLARSVGGTLYASRGDQGACTTAVGGGEISSIGMGRKTLVAGGFRNPMYLRCHYKDELCAATELGEDGQPGAKEKLVALRPDGDFGYPCCQGNERPTLGAQDQIKNGALPANRCTTVRKEDASFVLSDTPFGFDWERDMWPEPYRGAVFVALHGSFYTRPAWSGARIVFARVDPTTHMPIEGWRDFVGGFGCGKGERCCDAIPEKDRLLIPGCQIAGSVLDRPSEVAFAPDGRMFFADDQGGGVYWIAPASLARPN